MKRTKQVQKMVDAVNDYLKNTHVTSAGDSVFSTACWLLIESETYHGFNFFTEDGRLTNDKSNDFDHLQIY